jgi:hypothetical protein
MIDEQTPPEDDKQTPPTDDNSDATKADSTEKGQETDKESDFDDSIIDEDVKNYVPEAPKEEEEDEVDKEERERVEKIMQKKWGGSIEQIERKATMDSYLANNPEFAKYKPAIEKYWNHPTYKGLPIHNVAAIVAGKDMMKIGAIKERQAQSRQEENTNPGTSATPANMSGVNWLNAPKDVFEAQKAKVLGRQGL